MSEPRQRLLLLLSQTSYRTRDFVAAALDLDVELVCATDRHCAMQPNMPQALLELSYHDLGASVAEIERFAGARPIDAVVGIDDQTVELAAMLNAALGRPANAVEAVRAARDKSIMRQRLAAAAVAVPAHRVCALDADPRGPAAELGYPLVVKPLALSASRGVIRADDPEALLAAVERLRRLLARPDVALAHDRRVLGRILLERFVPGVEVAVEGMLHDGELELLCIFDKPDPLDGPFFEETIYVTPSRLAEPLQRALQRTVAAGARALGLRAGPVHAELRLQGADPVVIEIAPRSIGGQCSRCLRFASGRSLEQLILRGALGREADDRLLGEAAGVMMIPIPREGRLRRVDGVDHALAVDGVTEVSIVAHRGQQLVPLPEGAQYLGFIFARSATPAAVEAALRAAHAHIGIVYG